MEFMMSLHPRLSQLRSDHEMVNEHWREVERGFPVGEGQNDSMFPHLQRDQYLPEIYPFQDNPAWGTAQVGDCMGAVSERSQYSAYSLSTPTLMAAHQNATSVQDSRQGSPDLISTYNPISDHEFMSEPQLSPTWPAENRSIYSWGDRTYEYSHSSHTWFPGDETIFIMPPHNLALTAAPTPTPNGDKGKGKLKGEGKGKGEWKGNKKGEGEGKGKGNGKGKRKERGAAHMVMGGNNHSVVDNATLKCTHPKCKRPTKPFTRNHNLLQHRRQVHKEFIPVVKYRWGTPPEGDSGRKEQKRREATEEKEVASGV